MAARAGNGLDDIRQQAQGLVKSTGMLRLQVVNRNGHLVLDAGDRPEGMGVDESAAGLAEIMLRLRQPATDYFGESFEVVDFSTESFRVRTWYESPFVIAAWFTHEKAAVADKFGRERLDELITALQEELT